ncbi:MAG: GDP-mannose 4,6-dehydratase [Promethearchaeota archaeon]
MKALVTGAGGFIGSHLVDFCLSKGMQVVASLRPQKERRNLRHLLKTPPPNLEIWEVDIRDRESVEHLVGENEPDLIFHMAAQSLVIPSWEDPAYTMETNVLGTVYLFEAVKRLEKKCTVVVACSSAEYGVSYEHEWPLKESNPLRPVHPYGISKVAQEYLAKQYTTNFGVDTRIIRYFNQTGPRKVNDACSDFARRIGMIEAGVAEPTIRVGNLDTYRDITGIRDTLGATWAVYERGKPGETYNVCSGKPTLIREVLETLLSFSTKQVVVEEKTPEKLRLTDEPVIVGDDTRLRKELGYEHQQPLEEVLRDMFDYWRSEYEGAS